MLFRFYRASEGKIKIDGHEINTIGLQSLRQNLSMVSQDIVLFDDTVRNNIAYGQSARIDDEKLLNAAQAAYVDEFVKEFPDGYDTQIGERGVQLSGGQRQRLAIARAIYKDAPILVMDEATSSLDSDSEAKVQQAITELLKNRTTLIIAHRFSTIQQADHILVFSDGAIVERGTHKELIANNGHYARLYENQLQKNEQV